MQKMTSNLPHRLRFNTKNRELTLQHSMPSFRCERRITKPMYDNDDDHGVVAPVVT